MNFVAILLILPQLQPAPGSDIKYPRWLTDVQLKIRTKKKSEKQKAPLNNLLSREICAVPVNERISIKVTVGTAAHSWYQKITCRQGLWGLPHTSLLVGVPPNPLHNRQALSTIFTPTLPGLPTGPTPLNHQHTILQFLRPMPTKTPTEKAWSR